MKARESKGMMRCIETPITILMILAIFSTLPHLSASSTPFSPSSDSPPPPSPPQAEDLLPLLSPANEKSIVKIGKARFTILTSSFIRIEQGGEDSWTDGSTMMITNRYIADVDIPKFTTSSYGEGENTTFVIQTDHLKLHYKPNITSEAFCDKNLKITFHGSRHDASGESSVDDDEEVEWSPGYESWEAIHKGNLGGTFRTLDNTNGNVPLDCASSSDDALHCVYGLLSKNHFVILDDTGRPLLTQTPENLKVHHPHLSWITPRKQHNKSNKWCPSSSSAMHPPIEKRRACGADHIDQFTCESRGCCYEDQSYPSAAMNSNDKDTNDDDGESKKSEQTQRRCYYSHDASSPRDWYFLATPSNSNFKITFRDIIKFIGPPPLPPRAFFGFWFCRYWGYNEDDFRALLKTFESSQTPLDVFVMDMDWHQNFEMERVKNAAVDGAGQPKGWGGVTFDEMRFVDGDGGRFLRYLKSLNLWSYLNLHPASGVQPWEDIYDEVLQALHLNASETSYVALNLTDPHIMGAILDVALGRREEEGGGVSWWIDWQQGEKWKSLTDKISDINPTLWLNHLLYMKNVYRQITSRHDEHDDDDVSRTRSVVMSRFGGIGSHRYPVGFSGDVQPSWLALAYQVHFTVTASNVLFGYWSHDIGGNGYDDHERKKEGDDDDDDDDQHDELITRWYQWGAFSPLMRPHGAKSAKVRRLPWEFKSFTRDIMSSAIIKRIALVPYIYNQARLSVESGLSLLRPLYYETPTIPQAYPKDPLAVSSDPKNYITSYFFGDDLIIAPVTSPIDKATHLAIQAVNIVTPQNQEADSFYDVTFGRWYPQGATTTHAGYHITEIPQFMREGTPIPHVGGWLQQSRCAKPSRIIGQSAALPECYHAIIALKSPKAIHRVRDIYEDDGWSDQYITGRGARVTQMRFDMAPTGKFVFRVENASKKTSQTNPLTFRTPRRRDSANSSEFVVVGDDVDQVDSVPSPGYPQRRFELTFLGVPPARQLSYNGDDVLFASEVDECNEDCWTYDGANLALTIHVMDFMRRDQGFVIEGELLFFPPSLTTSPFVGVVSRAKMVKRLLDKTAGAAGWIFQEEFSEIMKLALAGRKITLTPGQAVGVVTTTIYQTWKAAIEQLNEIGESHFNEIELLQRCGALLDIQPINNETPSGRSNSIDAQRE